MPYGQHDHDHGSSSGAATMTKEPVPATVANPCAPPAIQTSTCCDLICFERPRYFCGHLLKDTDLTKEQQYVIEKHKLYHRTLTGHGVVCGLRLTCDRACCGDIRIDEGYAIDDCGNDIVVCDRARFDVIARLKEKGLLIPTSPKDPCDEEKEVSPCIVRQCFYVVICYQENEYDFTTPLSPACGPSPKDCEATRVRETYVFDVVDRLPARTSPLDSLKERMEHCFALFADPPFSATLEEVRRLICQDGSVPGTPGYGDGDYDKLHDLYCKLRGLLLLYLRKHPDQYNCRIGSDIVAIKFPKKADATGESIEAAICRLIEIAYNHVLSCLFGELAFPCPEPSRASCVVLGTVEVEDECVVRVCNCPREYVWTFPSFFQVLFSTLASSYACETVDAPDQRAKREHDDDCNCKKVDPTQTCCRTYSIADCCEFVERMASLGKSAGQVSTALFSGAQSMQMAMSRAFDPTRWNTVPASAFLGKTLDQVDKDPYLKEVKYHISETPLALQPPDPIEAFAQSFLTTPADEFVLETGKDGRIIAAQPLPQVYARVKHLEKEVARVATLEAEVASLKETILGQGRFPRGEGGGPASKGGRSRKTK